VIERRRHERYRQLMSARLDGQLSVLAERQLIRHLLSCRECRAIQNDYFEQRRQLRAMPPVQPPRDMWARTSAALDRELARRSWLPSAGTHRRLLPRTAVAGTAAALSLALVLGSGQLRLTPQPQPTDVPANPPAALLPTPFGVAPQRMTLLGADANGLVIYRADLDQVCPATALACLGEEDLAPQLLSLPRGVSPANLSVSPDGGRAAMTGTLSGRAGIYAFVLDESDTVGVLPTTPPDSAPPDTSRPDTPPETARPDAPPATSAIVTTPPPSGPPEDSPIATLAALEAPGIEPSPTSAAALAAVTILDDVQMAGAPPAWSQSGELLAFSAMPADGSHGPDIYLWRETDAMAEPLTTDHASYFASWADGRIVASRLVTDEGDGATRVHTVVIDLESGEERELVATDLWLPQVSPVGGQAVLWRGDLNVSPTSVDPGEGALYLTDWRAIDPFAQEQTPAQEPGQDSTAEATEEPATDDEPATEAAVTPEPAESESPTARPMITLPPADDTSPTPLLREEPAVSAKPSASDEPSVSPAADQASPQPQPERTDGPDEAGELQLVPLDADRDPFAEPVLDWQVRWSTDGAVVGYWVADAAGASWGRLVVRPVLAESAAPVVGEPLVGPTLARRTFTLGINRVAWVGASDEQPEGEVRIRTWGPGGEGGLRLPALDLREVVPAF